MKVTQKTLDLLAEKKVYTSYDGTSRLKIGDVIQVDPNSAIEPFTCFLSGNALWNMGSFSYSWTSLRTDISIGRYCNIAGSSRIFGTQHPYNRFANSSVTYDKNFVIFSECMKHKENSSYVIKPNATPPRITIGNDVWIGSHCALKPGITIHDGAIVATGAVVTKDVPPYAIVGGVPAKVIKMRFPDNIIWEMLKLQWWDYCFADFQNIQGDLPVEQFIEIMKQDIADGKLQKFKPEPLTGVEIIATEKD